jgi:hypothetical protein
MAKAIPEAKVKNFIIKWYKEMEIDNRQEKRKKKRKRESTATD